MTYKKILIIEDDATLRFIYQRFCQRFDLQATLCSSVEDALNEKVANFSAILIDHHLPNVTGLDFIKRLQFDGSRNVPIIAMTANVDPEIDQALLTAGADLLLLKPFLSKDLRLALMKVGVLTSGLSKDS